jgi:hypothetical protein
LWTPRSGGAARGRKKFFLTPSGPNISGADEVYGSAGTEELASAVLCVHLEPEGTVTRVLIFGKESFVGRANAPKRTDCFS